MHGLEAEYWGRIDFVYLDREDANNADIVSRYSVAYQPEFILIMPDGTMVQHVRGGMGEDQLRQMLDNFLASY